LYADLQAVVRTTQMHVDKLQLELDTVTRERVSTFTVSTLSDCVVTLLVYKLLCLRGILTELSLCCSIVWHFSDAQS